MADSPFTGESIPDLLRARVEASPDVEAYWHEADGHWHPTTWRQFSEKVDRLAAGLVSKGLTPGTHVGLLFPTSLEWEVAHHAVLRAGGVVVGLEPHDTAERLHWIIGHADVEMLIVQNRALYDKIAAHGGLALRMVVFVENEPVAAGVTRETVISKLFAREVGQSAVPAVRAEAAATIIYTSGTTGQPKGILYRHEQVVLAIKAITGAYPTIAVGSRFVCWLPLSNLFQRIMNLAAMQVGGTVFLVKNPLDVMKALPVARPDIFIGVPRFYEKLQEGILKAVDQQPAVFRWIARRSIGLASAISRATLAGDHVSVAQRQLLRLANFLVLEKLRRVMGGRIQFMITGSAPTPLKLLEFFHAIGLPIFEAYGMSENVVPIALNRHDAFLLGTVGKPLGVNSLSIAEDGELLVRGPGMFSGYYKDETRDCFTSDGYYRTGDYGALHDDGFLTLGGRKSEILKTSTGRRISPRLAEDAIARVPSVERAMVIGNGRKCLAAIVTLNPPHRTNPGMCRNSEFIEALKQATHSVPEEQRPGGFLILSHGFSIEGGELTTNLKLRRSSIEKSLSAEIEILYQELDKRTKDEPKIVWYDATCRN